jgi:alpha-1,6-mannosyl-glycoprotein beta-1,2-N-acetylglucosaminyltransferase
MKIISMNLFRALASRCKNAAYPDSFGHYREVSIVQIKHHWWWKVSGNIE